MRALVLQRYKILHEVAVLQVRPYFVEFRLSASTVQHSALEKQVKSAGTLPETSVGVFLQ